jgi:hypothetical protein
MGGTFSTFLPVAGKPLFGAAALMTWLGLHMPDVQKKARGFSGHGAFTEYMEALTGVTANRFDSHDEQCEGYLAALKRKYVARGVEAEEEKTAATAFPGAMAISEALTVIEGTTYFYASAVIERQRPRLTWADSKPADRFPGFVVKSCTNDQQPATGFASPDLQQTRPQIDGSRFGSAHLLKA